jgi:hypothetical protein
VDNNQAWLHEAGGSYNNPPSQEALRDAIRKVQPLKRIAAVIAHFSEGGLDWGVKDPRIIWLWSWYQELFRNNDLRIIITQRNRDDTARSLARVQYADGLERGYRVADLYKAALDDIAASACCPVLLLRFEDWRENRQKQEEKLEAFVGRELSFDHFRP